MNEPPRRPARNPASMDPLVSSLLETAHSVEARLERALDPLGLSLAKVAVLGNLAEAGEPLPLRELASRLSCVRSNITQLMDRLEKDGLVRRRSDPEDRRGVLATLTEAGDQAYVQAMHVLAKEQRAIVGSLNLTDAAQLKGSLKQLSR